MRALWVFLIGFALAVLALAPPARADTAATFGTALELYSDQHYAAALPLFREAHEASDSPNARFYIARCLREMGKLPEAYEEMKGTVADATARAETEKKYVPTRNSAAAELALLEPRIGKLVIAIADPPDEMSVTLNDEAVAPARLGAPLAVLPGQLTVVVEAAGKQTVEKTIDVPAGQTRTLALTLADAAGAALQPGDVVAPEEDDGTSGGGARIAGFVVAGVGLAGIAVFANTGSMAQSQFDDLQADCGEARCPDSEQGRVDDGRTLGTIANVSLGVGGALLLGGVAMIIFGGASEPDEAQSDEVQSDEVQSDDADSALRITPWLGPTAAGLGIAGTF